MHIRSCTKDQIQDLKHIKQLDMLAEVAITTQLKDTNAIVQLESKETETSISKVLEQSLVLPHVDESGKRKRKMVLDNLPDNLTSGECQ